MLTRPKLQLALTPKLARRRAAVARTAGAVLHASANPVRTARRRASALLDDKGVTMNIAIKALAVALLTSLSVGANSFELLPSADSSMHTEGNGAVAVVFESGLGDTGVVWRSVQSSVADHCARTVSYTRSGYGIGSSPVAGVRDAEHIVAELRMRLAESGVSPPYVLVGHSLGGLYMQYFARRFPAEVRGLVLVDSMHWNQLNRVKAATPGVYRMTNVINFLMGGTMRREFVGIPSTAVEIEALPEPYELPSIVLSSTKPGQGETPAFRTLAAELQREIATAYRARRHDFVSGSGHYIQRDQPQVVVNAARELAGCDTGDDNR
jgi:pimeloyl-ACP methyl ester carboxylesterase